MWREACRTARRTHWSSTLLHTTRAARRCVRAINVTQCPHTRVSEQARCVPHSAACGWSDHDSPAHTHAVPSRSLLHAPSGHSQVPESGERSMSNPGGARSRPVRASHTGPHTAAPALSPQALCAAPSHRRGLLRRPTTRWKWTIRLGYAKHPPPLSLPFVGATARARGCSAHCGAEPLATEAFSRHFFYCSCRRSTRTPRQKHASRLPGRSRIAQRVGRECADTSSKTNRSSFAKIALGHRSDRKRWPFWNALGA